MCFFYLVAMIFAGGAVFNVFQGRWDNVAFGLGIAAVLSFFGFLLGAQETKAAAFEAWLLENKAALLDGETLLFDGQAIELQTVLSRYSIVISFLIASTKTPTRYVVRGTRSSKMTAWAATLATLVLGWWSLPTGPLETVWTVGHNARGGQKTDVARLLNELVKAQAKAQPSGLT